MHLINISADATSDLIAAITEHLPVGHSRGRVLFVAPKQLIAAYGTCDCVWGDDAEASRHVAPETGEHEITKWHWGNEESRRIVHGD
jgi:hypothetical protein